MLMRVILILDTPFMCDNSMKYSSGEREERIIDFHFQTTTIPKTVYTLYPVMKMCGQEIRFLNNGKMLKTPKSIRLKIFVNNSWIVLKKKKSPCICNIQRFQTHIQK